VRLLSRIVRQGLDAATCKLFLVGGVPIPASLRTMYVVQQINQAEQAYVPQRYGGTITLFHGKDLSETDPNLGWNGLADRLDNFEIGDGGLRSRRDIMNEPLVGLLAKQLESCLEAGRSGLKQDQSVTRPVAEPAL
jgi:hypothetical protein